MVAVRIAPSRLARWVENFGVRHGSFELSVLEGRLAGTAADGSTFAAALPFGTPYAGPPDASAFAAACAAPDHWGVLLVRKGGFAVARLEGGQIVESKVGQRHVQGRTKAGGQSQQRFARRRDNQARAAYEAAAEHAVRILGRTPVLVTGGDEAAVRAVLEDPRLRVPAGGVVGPFLGAVADPRRSILEAAVEDALAVPVEVVNA